MADTVVSKATAARREGSTPFPGTKYGGAEMRKKKYVEPGYRIMDNAFLRDGENLHSGEALVLAVILHAKGKTKRGEEEVKYLAKMFNDPNQK